MRARVVLPVPGVPHSTNEKTCPCSIANRSGLPGPTRWLCPTNSSRFCGLIRLASGSIECADYTAGQWPTTTLPHSHLANREYNAFDTNTSYERRAEAARRIRRTNKALETLGPVPQRARVGNCSRGLFGAWERLGLF